MPLHIRERPPLRLSIEAETPQGRRYRWADDERRPQMGINDLTFSTTMPGGFENLGGQLPRDPAIDYTDLERLTTLRVCSPATCHPLAGEYRLERSPQTSGYEFSVSPDAAGHVAELEDNKAVKEVYIDQDFTKWQGMSTTRKIAYLTLAVDFAEATVDPDEATGLPSLTLQLEDTWGRAKGVEMLYDSKNVPIGSVYYAWRKSPGLNPADPNWSWTVSLWTDDAVTGTNDTSGNLRAAGPGTGTVTGTAATRAAALVQLLYNAAGGTNGMKFPLYWTKLAVYGRHGLTKRGTASANAVQGLLVSDIVGNAVQRFTTLDTKIEQGTYVVDQASYLEPTTIKAIIEDVDKYVLSDWGVWEDKTFFYNRRGGGPSRTWRAPAAASGLESTGPQVDRLWNSVVVQYQDVTGEARTVGPSFSGADSSNSLLQDDTKDNPLNQLGIARRQILTMETSTLAGAVEVGKRFLEEQKLLDTAGRAKITGYCMDDKGVLWPAHCIRAGDYIEFTDANDASARRVTKTSYSDGDKSMSVDLDSPPEGLAMVLERLGASTQGIV